MAYPPALGCDAELNAWCNANCPHSQEHGPLLARLGIAAAGPQVAWRCYAPDTLTPDTLQYATGSTYCTRHPQLVEVLDDCRRAGASPGTVCEDDSAECVAWAQYNQCTTNELWMSRHCAKSCGTCTARPAAAAKAEARTPPSPPPTPTPLVPSPPPPPPDRDAPLPVQFAEDTACHSTCGGATGGPERSPSRCSGNGACVAQRGVEWCDCKHSAGRRILGLQCERSIGVGSACAAGCADHGSCLHGHCECNFGWHGTDCARRGVPSPLLTQRKLLEAGLGLDALELPSSSSSPSAASSSAAAAATSAATVAEGVCVEPSIHQVPLTNLRQGAFLHCK